MVAQLGDKSRHGCAEPNIPQRNEIGRRENIRIRLNRCCSI